MSGLRIVGRVALYGSLAPLLWLAPGCGAGIAGLVFGVGEISDDDGGGSSNGPAVVSNVVVTARESPATISFVLTDAESDPADVEILYLDRRARDAVPVLLTGEDTDLNQLRSSPEGVRHRREWDFAKQEGETFQEGFVVEVRIVDRAGATPLAVSASEPFSLGNDPPELRDVMLQVALAGIANVAFTVWDSSNDDLVSVRVEYAVVDGGPEVWRLARPAGVASSPEGELPADFSAFRDVRASSSGTSLDFFWDVVRDVGRAAFAVKLRLTPDDGVAVGNAPEAAITTPPIKLWVENDAT